MFGGKRTSRRVVPHGCLYNRTVLASAAKMRKRVPAGMTPCGCGTPATPSATPSPATRLDSQRGVQPRRHRLAGASNDATLRLWLVYVSPDHALRQLTENLSQQQRGTGSAPTSDTSPSVPTCPPHGEIRCCCPRRSVVPSAQQWSSIDPGDEAARFERGVSD
jgi:hypothetical protein